MFCQPKILLDKELSLFYTFQMKVTQKAFYDAMDPAKVAKAEAKPYKDRSKNDKRILSLIKIRKEMKKGNLPCILQKEKVMPVKVL